MLIDQMIAYVFVICMIAYTCWGYELFNVLPAREQKWKIPWVLFMCVIIAGMAVYWGMT